MKAVIGQFEKQPAEIPFTMMFMSQPQNGDILPSMGNTMTSTYSTDSGPNSAPDDGETSTKDD
jgi:hypothetical protein